MNYSAGNLKYRADIDGLRAFAILAVLFYHANILFVTGGFIGVDIFFVISGYLITSIIFRETAERRFSIAAFYVRRALRILPAYFVMTLLAFAAGLFLLPPADLVKLSKSIIASALFVANIFFASQISYFGNTAQQHPLLHLWSLSVEEQFYIAWPLFAYFFFRIVPSKFRFVTLGVLTLAALVATEWALLHKSTTLVFFWAPFRAWELMIGAMVVLAPIEPLQWSFVRRLLSAIAVAFILLPIVLYTSARPIFPGLSALLPCLGSALVIYLGRDGIQGPVGRVLEFKPLRFIGVISYSLYLWHWPIFAYSHIIFGPFLSPFVTVAAIACSFVAAILSRYLIELPFLSSGKNRKKICVLGIAAAAVCVVCSFGAAGVLFNGLPQRTDAATLNILASLSQTKIAETCIRNEDARQIDRQPQGCEWGDGDPTDVVWGDSHAAAYFLGMKDFASKENLNVQLRSMQSCDPLYDTAISSTTGRADAACKLFNAASLKFLSEDKRIKRVFVSGFWISRFFPIDAIQDYSDQKVDPHELSHFQEDLTRVIVTLKAAGKVVVLLGEPPIFPGGGGECVKERAFLKMPWDSCVVSRKWADNTTGLLNNAIRNLADLNGVVFFDPTPVFCNEHTCAPFLNNLIAFRDRHHMNDLGSKAVSKYMQEVGHLEKLASASEN